MPIILVVTGKRIDMPNHLSEEDNYYLTAMSACLKYFLGNSHSKDFIYFIDLHNNLIT